MTGPGLLSATPAESISEDDVALDVTVRAEVDLDRARAAFADLSWLGRPTDEAAARGERTIAADLELPVLDGSGPSVRKAAIIEIGDVLQTRRGLSVPISWRSASMTPLFPVFAGRLEIRSSGLTLVGRYAPPFGKMGMLIDRALLHFVATRSASALLATVVHHCQRW